MPESLPLITVEGSPFELGFQHGAQCAEMIRFAARVSFPRLLQKKNSKPLEVLKAEALRYEPFIAKYAPHLIDELKGVAEGAGIGWDEVLLLQTRPELAYTVPKLMATDACTSFGICSERTKYAQPIVSQNVDMDPELKDLGIILRLRRATGPSVLTWTIAGVLGQTGINSVGLARAGNVLFSGGWRLGVPTSILFRLTLEQESIGQVVELCRLIPRSKSNNFVVSDRHGRVIDLEMTVDNHRVLEPENGILTHANHYCHPDFVSCDIGPYKEGSTLRQQRLETLLLSEKELITEEHAMCYMSDHMNHPQSICGHGAPGLQTVASCILLPVQGKIFVSQGNPCEAGYTCYAFAE